MKKYLAVFIVILALAAGLMGATFAAVWSTRADVEVRQAVFSGTPDAARGLTVSMRTRAAGRRLAWQTSFTLDGEDPEPESELEIMGEIPDEYRLMFREPTVSITPQDWCCGTTALSGGIDLGAVTENADEARLLRDVASRTRPGTFRQETVRMADWADSIGWSFNLHEWNKVHSVTPEDRERFGELFKISVPEDLYLCVTVGKNSSGSVTHVTVGEADGPADPVETPWETNSSDPQVTYGFGSYSLYFSVIYGVMDGDTGVCFYPSSKNLDGEEMVECALGRGVYFIPFLTMEEWQETSAEEPYTEPWSVNLDGLKLLYPLEAEMLRMELNEGRLELYTKEAGKIYFTAIDTSTGEELSRFEVMEAAPEGESLVIIDGSLALVVSGNELGLVDRSGGAGPLLRAFVDMEKVYTRGNSSNYEYKNSELFARDGVKLAWDGERLAVASWHLQEVMIVDASGEIYHAQFILSSLDSAACSRNNGLGAMDSYYLSPMEISFD